MEQQVVSALNKWSYFTNMVLDLKEVSTIEMSSLLTETYNILKHFSKKTVIPKAVCRLILNADEFLYFASIIEEGENKIDFYHFAAIHRLITAFKNGFFTGVFEYKTFTANEIPLTIKVNNNEILNFLNTANTLSLHGGDFVLVD